MSYFEGWSPYVSSASRKRQAEQYVRQQQKKGKKLSPVTVSGRVIAQSVWGDAWCRNLESYSDYENRLPRGRTYVRSGAVIDLQIRAGAIAAQVQGSRLYQANITVQPVHPARWQDLCTRCAGGLGSLIELLSGRLSRQVMAQVTDRKSGLFPAPAEMKLSCSCPDWATMCKHVAATLYGVGARLDAAPELLFVLRSVDPSQLVTRAGADLPMDAASQKDVLAVTSAELGALFDIELGTAEQPVKPIEPGLPVAAPSIQPASAPIDRAEQAELTVTSSAGRRERERLPTKPEAARLQPQTEASVDQRVLPRSMAKGSVTTDAATKSTRRSGKDTRHSSSSTRAGKKPDTARTNPRTRSASSPADTNHGEQEMLAALKALAQRLKRISKSSPRRTKKP